MAKALTHPADGLYSFSYMRGVELQACRSHLDWWYERHALRETPITFADMVWQESNRNCIGSAVSWLLMELRDHGRITHEEHDLAIRSYSRVRGCEKEVRVLMDTLLARAKREGLVPA